MLEVALALPLLVVLLVGLVEVAFAARSYLVLLEASREGARLGARGAANFDNTEISTLVQQDLSREGYTIATGLKDIVIVRADVGPGTVVNTYQSFSMLGSGRPATMNRTTILSRLQAGDPQSKLVVVEVYYDHRPLLRFPLLSDLFPDPFTLHTYSVMRMLQ